MQLVFSAENSSLDWKAQYKYIEDIGDGRGYTAGIIGFCSGTGDMLDLVERYTNANPGNPLETYLPALRKVNGTSSHAGLGSGFVSAWQQAAGTTAFKNAQNSERDRVYFNPAVNQGKSDGLGAPGTIRLLRRHRRSRPRQQLRQLRWNSRRSNQKGQSPVTGRLRNSVPQRVHG